MYLKILSKSKVIDTVNSFPSAMRGVLTLRYLATIRGDEDRKEFPIEHFWSDLISQVAYRAGCEIEGLGVDGNWTEFIATYGIEDSVYKDVLHFMELQGFNARMERW